VGSLILSERSTCVAHSAEAVGSDSHQQGKRRCFIYLNLHRTIKQ
jgi:hypothetical protein